MTITLTWKHALAGVALLAVLVVSVWLMVRSAQQQSVLDAERVQRIAELEDELESALHAAGEAKDDADEARDKLNELMPLIGRGRLAIAHQKKYRSMTAIERVTVLQEQNSLLEQALILSRDESQALRRSLTHMGIALTSSRERYDLLNKRYSSLKRSKKKEKRRKILTAVGTSIGSFGIGVGIGKI